jgi:calmodulin
LVDKDGGGSITGGELAMLMNTLGIDTSPEEIECMIEELDEDSNGEIDFDEFVAVMGRKVSTSFTATQVKASFKVFQGGAEDGKISVESLLSALTNFGSTKLGLEEASELVRQSSEWGFTKNGLSILTHPPFPVR